ncbi:universal stress protein [Mucilaginibacter conchicola]|uniref:Universal stress protein n=1 Tax=Mucilaginibacter conchicola TaxID=2303333 RepID=A0A372NLY0_9SPHI|nr:universal stress protein [Mucilaginibacter conchicola]RFZ89962.1 universal stress protein [Mucilaginibacter conchicola]
MKRLLVLTDFSKNAAHAAVTAVHLAKQIHAGLLVFHAYEMMPVDPYLVGASLIPDPESVYAMEGEKQLKLLADDLQTIVRRTGSSGEISIQQGISEGDLGRNLKNVIAANQIEMIVMGGSTGSTFDHFLGGQETMKVINHSTKPVLIIPQESAMDKIQKLVFATTYHSLDINAISYLADLSKLLEFEIDIVHVDVYKTEDPDLLSEIVFKRFVNGLGCDNISYHEVKGKNVVSRLNSYCRSCSAEVLAMVHHRKGFMKWLFDNSQAKKELQKQAIPVIIFPPDFIYD